MDTSNQKTLAKLIDQGNAVKSVLKMEGWEIIKEHIDAIILDKHSNWLKARSKESAEVIRLKTSSYKDIYSIIGSITKAGDNAQQILSRNPSK